MPATPLNLSSSLSQKDQGHFRSCSHFEDHCGKNISQFHLAPIYERLHLLERPGASLAPVSEFRKWLKPHFLRATFDLTTNGMRYKQNQCCEKGGGNPLEDLTVDETLGLKVWEREIEWLEQPIEGDSKSFVRWKIRDRALYHFEAI